MEISEGSKSEDELLLRLPTSAKRVFPFNTVGPSWVFMVNIPPSTTVKSAVSIAMPEDVYIKHLLPTRPVVRLYYAWLGLN